jgi:hypothetical protein
MTASPWLFSVGRLAFARQGLDALDGWRHLWWRLWWRLPPVPALPSIFAVPRVLHWIHDGTGYPLCGARQGAPWTVEFHAVTCADCLREGLPFVIRERTNTR